MGMTHTRTFANIAATLCLMLFSAALASCSTSDDEQENNGRKLRKLTIAQVPVGRATLSDDGTTMGASWTAGDLAEYFNITSFQVKNEMDFGTIEAASSAITSAFSGTVRCEVDDKIAILYPATAPSTQSNRGTFTISLGGQDGTLAGVAANYHYVYGVGTVTSVTENTATATVAEMNSLLSVCKFTFKDGGGNPIPVRKLDISYADYDSEFGYSEPYYPPTALVTPNADAACVEPVVVAQASWAPLTVSLSAETSEGVYVALFPVSGQYFHFTVTNSSGTYTGTARATLNAGKYYPVNLVLTKRIDH